MEIRSCLSSLGINVYTRVKGPGETIVYIMTVMHVYRQV